MIIIIGLIIVSGALIAGVAGVLGNGGSGHAVSHFSVLGYHLTGSAGSLFLSGIVVGAAGLAGLVLLLAGARRTSRRASAARRGLRQSRRETAAASQERDNLIDQRDAARTASPLSNSTVTAIPDRQPGPAGDRWNRLRDLRNRLTPAQTPAQPGAPGPDVPANSPGPDVTASPAALAVGASTPAAPRSDS